MMKMDMPQHVGSQRMVFVVLTILTGLIMQTLHSPVSSDDSSKVFLPIISQPHCTSHNAKASISAPAQVLVSTSFKATITLLNLGCSEIKNPFYTMAGGNPTIWAKPHPPYTVPITIPSGSGSGFTYTLFAPDGAIDRFKIRGGVSFYAEYTTGEFERFHVEAPFVYAAAIEEE